MEVDKILKERGEHYGEFNELAEISQSVKCAMFFEHAIANLDAYQTEALEMIAHKIARILNGDPNYADSWLDIAGYAKLVADRLAEGEPTETNYGTEGKPISQKKVKKAFKTLVRAGVISKH